MPSARTLATKERHLADVPLFVNLSKRDLREVARRTTEIELPAGTTLISEGEKGREMFIVVEGTVVIRRSGRKIATRGPGAALGEMALLDDLPRSASVIAETDVVLFVVSDREFSEMVDTVGRIARKLLAALSVRLREAEKRLL